MNKIKEARKAAGMSQKFVAMTLGVKGPSVSNWESGKTTPTPDNLAALAELFNVSVDYLLGRDEAVLITGNPGSGKSSILSGDWYPSTPPQPPLVLDGGPTRGIIEDRPETEAIRKNIMKKLDELAEIYDQAYTDVDGYVDFLLHKNVKP